MRSSERFLVFGGVLAALAIALGARVGGERAMAAEEPGRSMLDTPPRIATVDMYAVSESYMRLPELSAARDDVVKATNAKLDAIKNEAMQLRIQLQGMTQNDPKARDLAQLYQKKEQDAQRESAMGNRTLEVLNAKQYGDAYDKILAAIDTLADKGGYTHVFNSRARSGSPVDQNNPGGLYQQILGRPVVKSPAADDLTAAVFAELKLQPVPAAAAPAPPAAPPAPATTPADAPK